MAKEQSAVFLLSLSIGLALAVDICEYQMNGVRLAHPADCNMFVECQNGKTYRISSCPLGLHFNRFKGVCDLRQRAACDIEFVYFVNEQTNCSACCSLYGCYVNPECPETPGTSTPVVTPGTTLMPEESSEIPTTLSSPATPEITSHPGTSSPNTPSSPFNTTSPETSTPDVTPDMTLITETATTEVSSEIPTTLNSPATPEITSHPGTSSPNTPSSPFTTASPETPTSEVTLGTTLIPPTPTTGENTEMPATSSTPATPNTPSLPVTPTNPNKCANNLTICQEESDNSVVHVNGTCNQFIVCVAGCAYTMSCPANLQYDIARQVCDYPENVDCPWQSTNSLAGPSGVTCAHHGQCEKQRDGKLFANANSDGYTICQCECEVERSCPEGTKFDIELKTCAWKPSRNTSENENNKQYSNENKAGYTNEHGKVDKISIADGTSEGSGNSNSSVCRNNIEICKNQSEGKLFPVDGVCNKFYKCNLGCAVEILCPKNLVYNPHVKHCDYPHNYKCPLPFTQPSGSSVGKSCIACASGGRCVGQLDGTLLPSLTSCAKYVVCQCECEEERDCAKNLYWDRNFLTCNYSAYVTCDLNL